MIYSSVTCLMTPNPAIREVVPDRKTLNAVSVVTQRGIDKETDLSFTNRTIYMWVCLYIATGYKCLGKKLATIFRSHGLVKVNSDASILLSYIPTIG